MAQKANKIIGGVAFDRKAKRYMDIKELGGVQIDE